MADAKQHGAVLGRDRLGSSQREVRQRLGEGSSAGLLK